MHTSPTSWWDLVESAAQARPDAPFTCDELGRALTFAEYRTAALEVAAGLAERGITAGSVVSWQLPTGLEALVLMSALARLGAVQNPLIMTLRDFEVDFIAGELDSALLITVSTWRSFDHAAMARRVADTHHCEVMICDAPTSGGSLGLPHGDPAGLPPAPTPGPTDLRWVYYTSGTTGAPKGVCHADATLIASSNAYVESMGMTADDVVPMAFPLAHIGGGGMVALSFRVGVQTPMIADFSAATSPVSIARFNPTALGSATPFFMAYLAAQAAHGEEPLYPRLRMCLAGGAALAPGLNDRVKAELGAVGIYNGWGLTECPISSVAHATDTDDRIASTVGRPAPDVEVRVVGMDGVECKPDEEGELRLRGPQRFLGYKDSSLDADGIDELGFVRTGDLGRVDEDGWVHITGRLKEIVIRNGENISTREVEDVLLVDPKVGDVAIVGLPDDQTGERCCACVVPAASAGLLSLDDITGICRTAGLAPYKWPAQVELYDALPRNSMGKILKAGLRADLIARSA